MNYRKRALGIAVILAAMLTLVFTLTVSARQASEAASSDVASLSPRVPGQFLTGPNAGAPLDIALAYINDNADALGLTAADLADVVVSDQYMSQHNGVTHIYLQQRLNGIRVHNAILNINIAADGSVINLGNRFVSNLSAAIVADTVNLTAAEAVDSAARQLGYEGASPQLVQLIGGASQEVLFDGAGVSHDPIRAQLMYQPTDNGVRLAWDMTINELNADDWWSLRVDAATGRILSQINYVIHENAEVPGRLVDAKDVIGGPADTFVPPGQGGGPSYRVFAYPLESPDDGGDTLEFDPADATASPFGWHDTDGSAGAEFTITQGNNVHADSDLDANNAPDGNAPNPGASLIFDYPFNLTLQPSGYLTGSIVNLFYWNNVMHDVLYHYGFDEPSGNFQENNYGNGGAGSDYVNADAQDGSGTCNANFGTPADGSNPRMQQFTCDSPFSQQVTINSPISIAGDYVANPSNNGGTANGLTADMELVQDGTAPFDDACETVTNDLTGKIALIRWSEGLCNSSVFVANAATAGAIAAIIIDNTDVPLTNFGGSAAIPSVAVGASDGQSFVDELNVPSVVNATIDDNPAGGLDRDTDLDNGIIAHEYGHGVSNRLTGGPSQVGCLSNSEQMGEGWSDLMTIFLHTVGSDSGTDAREIGAYGLGFSFAGIRNFPYSTDMAINPETYSDIADTNLPHGLGSIWVNPVYEVYWSLVAKHGFNPNIYDAWNTGGNNLTFQLVMDGMKLQPCNPGFVDGRDAILAADMALTGGENQCEIWQGFAKRGVGLSADQGSTNDVTDGVQAFDMPLECMPDETIATGPDNVTLCAGDSYNWEVALGSFPEPPVNLTAGITPDPTGTNFSWSTNPVNSTPATTTLTLDSTSGVTMDGFYTINITGTSGTAPAFFDMHVTFDSVAPSAPTIVAPVDGAVDAGYMPKLTWSAVSGATGYDVELATDAGFTNIIDSGSTGANETTFPVSVLLNPGTTYYWRVTVNTTCGSATADADFTTYDASCAPEEFTRDIYSEDFSGGESGWTHGSVNGNDTWTITNANPGPGSGGNAFYAQDLGEPEDQYLVSPAIAIPSGDTDYKLSFNNEQLYEDPAGSGGCWDGGSLEISTDGGSNWTPVDSELITDPYDGLGNNGPPTGINMWCGQINGSQPWLQSVANLDAYAGQTVHFRMHMLSDAAVGGEGWYIDDVSVSSCSVTPTDVSLSSFGDSEGSTLPIVAWLLAVVAAVAGASLLLRRRLVRE